MADNCFFETATTARLVRGGKKMYAIVECGGKQYKVEKDMLVKVEKLDAEVGATVDLKVLMLANDGVVKAGADCKDAKGQCCCFPYLCTLQQ